MSRNLEEKMMQYVKLIGKDSPDINKHFALRNIYDQYGVMNVDNWLRNYYEKVLDIGMGND